MTRGRLAAASFALALALLLSSCGGGSPVGPGPTPTPSPPPGDVHTVTVVVYYDENQNGVLDPGDRARVPSVTVAIAGRTAQTEKTTGRAVVSGVPAGLQTVSVQSTPPFYAAGLPVSIAVPTSADVDVALSLPIGSNRPNTYMAFGDSITIGDGSKDGLGYRGRLEAELDEHFGRAAVINAGAEATRSTEGAERIGRNLRLYRPAYNLIHYGTNDWNECKGAVPCVTIDSLRAIVESTKAAQTLPVLATIIPANPDLNPSARNEWVSQIDELIRPLARDEGALLVDLEAAFLREPDLTQLYADHVHPNDRGYRIMADEFFRAITEPSASSADWDAAEAFDLDPRGDVTARDALRAVGGERRRAYHLAEP